MCSNAPLPSIDCEHYQKPEAHDVTKNDFRLICRSCLEGLSGVILAYFERNSF